jgi:hypothetical protein
MARRGDGASPTRRPGVARCRGFARSKSYRDSTVSQSPRIARSTNALGAEHRHRRLSPMSSPRRPSRGGRGRAAASLSRPVLLGTTAARIRRPALAAPAGGPGAGRPRRQPYGPDVHGGSERRLALRRASPRGVRQSAHVGSARRWSQPPRGVHHGRDPLRAARQQADAGRDHLLRAVPPAGTSPPATRPRRRRARSHRMAGVPQGAARARGAAAAAGAPIRARRPREVRGRDHADRFVSSQPAEHLHGEADAADAARDLPDGATSAGRRGRREQPRAIARARPQSIRSVGRRGRSPTVSVSSRR